MLLLIAWRNIWRNRIRSLVVIAAIAVGIGAIALSVGFMNSMSDSFIRNSINHDYSHLQLHHPRFRQEPEVRFSLPHANRIVAYLRQDPAVKAFSRRLLINGMIASSRASAGVQIYGINREQEAATTSLDSLLEEGTYFTGKSRNAILISRKMADKLKAGLRTKLVLTFQDVEGNVVAGAFRVQGIFDSPSPRLNEGAVYVRQQDLSPLLGTDTLTHEIAVLLHANTQVLPEARYLRSHWPMVDVKTWEELSPELDLMQEQSGLTMTILLVILMVALAFGIVNTMLMAVLERERELGMLMAIGMNRQRIFSMILLETIFLALVGGPIGCLLGYATVTWLGNTGIDLSAWTKGLQQYGYSTQFYPFLTPREYFLMVASVVLTAILSALYPSYKAIRLNPVEAMRS
ncbi:ABC transporter permease [Pontibacter anaerobius]|uniref:FtsX-like permease family protein n=1 Tax=Pontibacter anaerobius TaxID=2993940 RepID=A0ABT3RE42_9BACT|nr:FtsX-like permease family protein [Pontibacter anaerobius]MCX2739815.1 FtsX-like permease family protein [Pontibacter anaerobius]